MIVYHEANPDAVETILTQGLKRTSRGEKGADDAIIQTDHLLDMHLPEALRQAGVSRNNNTYGYLTMGRNLISIEDGSLIPITYRSNNIDQVVLRCVVEPQYCYVSNLDMYDRIKSAITRNEGSHVLDEMAHLYWDTLIRLDQYTPGEMTRPEVMITYTIPPDHISVDSSS